MVVVEKYPNVYDTEKDMYNMRRNISLGLLNCSFVQRSAILTVVSTRTLNPAMPLYRSPSLEVLYFLPQSIICEGVVQLKTI